MIAAVDFRVAVQRVGEPRPQGLVVEGGEIPVALQAVLLGRRLHQHEVFFSMGGVRGEKSYLNPGILDNNQDGVFAFAQIRLHILGKEPERKWLDRGNHDFTLEIEKVILVNQRYYLSGRYSVFPCNRAYSVSCFELNARFENVPVVSSFEELQWLFYGQTARK